MKANFCLLFLIFVRAAAAGGTDPSLVPTEDFARSAIYQQVRLSPDGKTLCYIGEHNGDSALMFADLEHLTLRGASGAGETRWTQGTQQVMRFSWIGDHRVAFLTTLWDIFFTGVSAIDSDFTHLRPLSGINAQEQLSGRALDARVILHYFDDEQHSILMLDRGGLDGNEALFPEVIKVDTMQGRFETVVRNPGNVIGWGVDFSGVVRGGVTREGRTYGLIYRASAADAWHRVPATPGHPERIRPIAFDPSEPKVYVSALTPERHWSIFVLDPVTGDLGPPLVVNPTDFDISPPGFGQTPSSRAFISRKTGQLLGIFYVTDGPHYLWLDPAMSACQRLIDQQLPRAFNAITDMSRDERKLLIYSSSDRNPGSYYILDLAAAKLQLLVSEMPWIKPEVMAAMYPIKYQARDGRPIHGYMTLPNGRGNKHLPLVILPHDGPDSRDVWGFNPLVQLLANRGYAVLQMNFRGSPGYGEDFGAMAVRGIGHGIQDDIEDGAKWAVQHGIADGKRVAIVGDRFGGFSALYALGRSPGLYRCGITLDGISDWPRLVKDLSDDQLKFVRDRWLELLGDPKKNDPALQAISPVNFADKIAVPVLLIHDNDDMLVASKQSKEMIAALEKAGHVPESLFVSNGGHVPYFEKARIVAYKRIEAFLAKNMGP